MWTGTGAVTLAFSPRWFGAWLLGVACSLSPVAGAGEAPVSALVRHGEYVFLAAGCGGCHTDVENDGAFLAGGRVFKTPFGIFYSPNITSHPTHGIGSWTLAEFTRAIRTGTGPGGRHYYPVFPYPSYTGMLRDDVAALHAYLLQTPPVAQPSRAHQLPWYMGFRIVNWAWKLLFLKPGPYQAVPGRSQSWNRGAYLVTALTHCGECHTPRNPFGALDSDMQLAGTVDGPEDTVIPNITLDADTGIGDWTRSELVDYLGLGEVEDGPYADGMMAEVIEDGLQYLGADDIDAIAEYVWSLPARRNDAVAEAR